MFKNLKINHLPITQKEFKELYEQTKAALLESEQEKARLQSRLQKYTHALGLNAKKHKFSENEKLFLYGATAYPDLNDGELSKKIGLKRSTITAIKNRLKSQQIYREIIIPNLEAIGCKALAILYGSYDQKTKELEEQFNTLSEISRFIGMQYTDTCFFALFATDNIIMLQKEVDPLLNEWARRKLCQHYPTLVIFPFELNKVRRFLDYAPLLDHLFKLGMHKKTEQIDTKPNMKLTKNVKEVLYAIVKYPEDTTSELAKKLRLSRTTVMNLKKKILKKGIARKAALPRINKIGFEVIALNHFRFAPGATIQAREVSSTYTRGEPHAILKVSGDKETIAIRVFTDYTEESELIDKAVGLYNKHGFLLEDPIVLRLVPEHTKIHKFNFAPITKEMLKTSEL